MIYIFSGLFFLFGIVIGYKYCAYINGRIFQALADQGVIVIKTEDGWQGLTTAIESIWRQFNKEAESEVKGR